LIEDLDHRDDNPRFSSRARFLSLCSDFGWSVYLDTIGDKDPASSRPELVRIQKGTPTNSRTGERKFKIRDGPGVRFIEYPDEYPLTRGPEYLPRLSVRVLSRKVYWSSRSQEFEATVYFSLEPSPEWQQRMRDTVVTACDDIAGYRGMNDKLWLTHSTSPCGHPVQVRFETPIKLGPDAVALIGYSSAFEAIEPCPERVLIFLTRSDPRIRWLAIAANARSLPRDPFHRSVMLRTMNCCDECALEHVASLPGRWSLIL